MPKYRYVGTEARVIPDLSREVEPGDEVELDTDTPGALFEPVAGQPAAETPPAPEPAPAPEG